MTITDRLKEMDKDLVIHNEGEWSGTHNDYSAFNDAGVECEVGEFLYAMTRLIKPQTVLETGTHWGISASYIGLALSDNQKGILQTFEFLTDNFKIACNRLWNLGLLDRKIVFPYLQDVATMEVLPDSYDLILLDTEPQTRFAELVKFYPALKEGGYVFIHDLHRHMHQIPNEEHGFAWPYGEIPEQIKQWVREDKLRPFHLPTPRGLTGFYKPTANDYVWK
jgi:predicted O-methyltransferase YrrM